ncbi:carbonic anhydrase [Isoptericola sp. b441]|uniref:carbonic anhydrase n=1 Tax=Actinotalea lenta TaxID=3064654 RepID=A0ABT9D7M9_9CELL|nr:MULTISPECIES: carbonic anhydrase [unclassified Isoptericola]MDO8106859.1 carbonic anhydrase [Isoptericola sp. b441]MDO8121431.1 carbonic anhydrase [Isoptericola sp. b490]
MTPGEAWSALLDGNERFVADRMHHPSQDATRRGEIAEAQHPFAVVFGCSDSRVAAEIVFDRGLGNLFVIRTAGHVVDTTVIGSIEYGVVVAGASLVVVLGHDSCGAVAAAAHALSTGTMPTGFVRAVVDRVIPSIVELPSSGDDECRVVVPSPAALGRGHITHTVDMLMAYSTGLATAVADGSCAVVGAEYTLAEGRVRPVTVRGSIA